MMTPPDFSEPCRPPVPCGGLDWCPSPRTDFWYFVSGETGALVDPASCGGSFSVPQLAGQNARLRILSVFDLPFP